MTATSLPPLTFGEAVRLRVAVADQQHTLRRVAELTPVGATVTASSTWFRTVGMRLMAGLGDGSTRLCPHLGPRRGFGPMYCVLQDNPEIMCRDCLTSGAAQLDPIQELTCDRCNVYARGLVSGALTIGPLLLIFGVCRACAGELGVKAAGR